MSSSARGRGGKFSKPKRGGGKHFSRDLQPLNADGEVISMWADRDAVKEESEDDDEEESSEESSEDDDGQEQPQTREQRKALAKARKEAAIAKQKAAAKAAAPGDLPPSDSEDDDEDDDEMPANPNHTSKARQQLSATPDQPAAKKPVAELSRREREALQAQQARERYQKLHAEGKTDEARADLERLRLVREQREAAAARKKAEAEEKAEAEKAKKEQLERERKQREAALGPGASKRGARGGKKK